MKKLLKQAFPFFIGGIITVILLLTKPEVPKTETVNTSTLYKAEVSEVVSEKEIDFNGTKQLEQRLKVLVLEGPNAGEEVFVSQGGLPVAYSPHFSAGDSILLAYQEIDGTEIYSIADFQRSNSLWVLVGIFLLVLVLIGKKEGLRSLMGMAFSFVVVFLFLLPYLVTGSDPVFVVLVSGILIIPITFYISHGVGLKTHLAILGTASALIITGILAYIFINMSHLSGLASESAQYLKIVSPIPIEFKGLLLGGIIISLIGILDDVTITQASVVEEIYESNQKLSFKELYKKGMKVGRDHISSMVNTLILVYTGASLPMLLLFTDESRAIGQVLNLEMLASEIVQTLVASTGLILAVPITTLVAAHYCKSFAKANELQ